MGTEEAKARFQNMRRRYDQLREQIARTACSGSGADAEQQQSPKEETKGSSQRQQKPEEETNIRSPSAADKSGGSAGSENKPAGKSTSHRNEAYEEDENPATQKPEEEEDPFACDYDQRESLEAMAWKMLFQLKNIQQNNSILDTEFRNLHDADA